MYNGGGSWSKEVVDFYLEQTMYSHRLVEIGCGDGSLLDKLAIPHSVGFDPAPLENVNRRWQFVNDYFMPTVDIRRTKPDTIIMRHVLEHMPDPVDFLDSLAFICYENGLGNTELIVEVPCNQKARKDARQEDWTYEHPHHFSLKSLSLAMSRWDLRELGTFYNGEVAYAVATPIDMKFASRMRQVNRSYENATYFDWFNQNKPIVWGGAGKSAFHLQQLHHSIGKLPIVTVTDADERKHGKYVPGLPYKIVPPREVPAGKPFLVLTTWRLKDIVDQIREISSEKIYYFEAGVLREYVDG
jgi:hypothetical protein